MRTLQESISRMDNKGGAGATLRKHLGAVGINEWDDITRTALYDLRDHLGESVSAGSAKTILAYFKSLLNRYSDELTLPGDWAKILSAKGDASRGTYLTIEELRAFESVPSHLRKERLVQVESLIEAYTGARVSDVMTFSEENFKDGYLTYTSIRLAMGAAQVAPYPPFSMMTARAILGFSSGAKAMKLEW